MGTQVPGRHLAALKVEKITAGGTWVVPAGVTSIKVTCIGGGAGGGNGAAGNGVGGCGGGGAGSGGTGGAGTVGIIILEYVR